MTIPGTVHVGIVWKPIDGMENIYIGRGSHNPSPLGNPYIINGTCSRDEACDKYVAYLRHAIKNKAAVKSEMIKIAKLVMSGKDVNLLCYCKGKETKRCHGEFIKQLIDAAVTKKLNKE